MFVGKCHLLNGLIFAGLVYGRKIWSAYYGLNLTSTLRRFAETGSVTHASDMRHDAAMRLKFLD